MRCRLEFAEPEAMRCRKSDAMRCRLAAYLNNPVSQRVRTNNNVKRTNRMIRFWEKVRYKWRRRETLVRFVVLRLDDIWSHWVPIEAQETKSAKVLQRRKRQAPTGQESRQVA